MGRECGLGGSRRGQSSTIGLVLVLGMVIAATTTTVALGAVAIEDSRDRLGTNNADNALTQLDSQAALVALGDSDRQQVNLGGANPGNYYVDDSAGEITVSFDKGGTTTRLFQRTLGAVVHEGGETRTVYQGGGVWRSSGDGSVMVSPPEFHYRDETLTMPLVTVTGGGTISNTATITQSSTTQHFPDPSHSPPYENPLEAKNLVVTVQSEYYEAWGSYFEERTEGTVSYDHVNNEARIELVPPFDAAFENVIATTSPGGIDPNGADRPKPSEEGVNYPSPDPKIEDTISDCNSGGCPSVPGTITSAGTYYHGAGSDYKNEKLKVDNPDGDVLVVVDGDFEPKDVVIEDVDSGNSVTVYVRGDFNFGGNVKLNGDNDADPTEFRVFVHSDGGVANNGNSGMYGVVLAPGSHCDLNGGGSTDPNLKGSWVCDDVDINGKPNNFEYPPSVAGMDLGISNPETVRLQYLHVSTTEIEVEE